MRILTNYPDTAPVPEGVAVNVRGRSYKISGDGLCVGYDSGDAVSQEYKAPGEFKGGTIFGVGVTVEKTDYRDLEKEAQRLMMVQ